MDALTVKPSIIKTNESVTTEIPDLSSLVPSYLSELDVAPSSKETYRTALDHFFKFLRDRDIKSPTRADILEYKESLLLDHTAKTVNLKLSVLRSFFSWTYFYRVYPNIGYGIKGVREEKGPKRSALTSEQIKSILESFDLETLCGRQKLAITLLAATAGLRVAEISTLDVGDLGVVQNTCVLRVKGKGYRDKGQLVQIGRRTDEAIRSALALRDSLSPADPLFISTSNFSYGNRISARGISKILRKVLDEHDFRGGWYSPHSLRHSACCLSLQVTDHDLLTTKRFMRHQDLSTTLTYAHEQEMFSANIAQQIEDLLL